MCHASECLFYLNPMRTRNKRKFQSQHCDISKHISECEHSQVGALSCQVYQWFVPYGSWMQHKLSCAKSCSTWDQSKLQNCLKGNTIYLMTNCTKICTHVKRIELPDRIHTILLKTWKSSNRTLDMNCESSKLLPYAKLSLSQEVSSNRA